MLGADGRDGGGREEGTWGGRRKGWGGEERTWGGRVERKGWGEGGRDGGGSDVIKH